MKNILMTLLSMSCLIAQALHLKAAIDNRAITANWSGINSKNLPTAIVGMKAPSMQAIIQNKTASAMDIELEEGFFLTPEEKGYQRMLITQKIIIKLKPNERKEIPLYAMCTQLSHSGPNAQLKFRLGDRASGDLLALAEFIAQKNYQNFAAQYAVWSFTDQSSILGINSSNTVIENELQAFVAKAMKVDLQKLKQAEQARNNAGEQLAENLYQGKKIDRNIAFKNDSLVNIKIGFYDLQDNLLASLIDSQTVVPGHHSIRYNPFPLSLSGKRYTVKMYKDNELFRIYYFRQ